MAVAQVIAGVLCIALSIQLVAFSRSDRPAPQRPTPMNGTLARYLAALMLLIGITQLALAAT